MIKPLVYISINNASAESLKYTRGFPSPDTLLRRLERLNLRHIVDALNEANRVVLSGYARDGMKMAIDNLSILKRRYGFRLLGVFKNS